MTHPVIDITEDDSRWAQYPGREAWTQRAVTATLAHLGAEKCAFEISFLLTNDVEIRKLNGHYRYKDAATNVLSFPQQVFSDHNWEKLPLGLALGDVVVALETLVCEAEAQGKTLENHFVHLVVHSLLHLLGYDHMEEADAREMEDLEIGILRKIDIPNPYEVNSPS